MVVATLITGCGVRIGRLDIPVFLLWWLLMAENEGLSSREQLLGGEVDIGDETGSCSSRVFVLLVSGLMADAPSCSGLFTLSSVSW